jgi:hypothetical protein
MSSHTAVLEIDLKDTGSVSLTVEVIGFEPGTKVEISGHATQDNGVIATFYDVQELPPPEIPGNPDSGSILTITADPAAEFVAGEVITVAGQARAVKIWGTILDGDPKLRPGTKAVWRARPETPVAP